jgi:hypothetical protein
MVTTVAPGLERAFRRIVDSQAVQTGTGLDGPRAAALRVQESVGIDDDAHVSLVDGIERLGGDVAPASLLPRALVGLMATELAR